METINISSGNNTAIWTSPTPPPCRIDIDLKKCRSLSGVWIDWGDNHGLKGDLWISLDETQWEKVSSFNHSEGFFDTMPHDSKGGRFLRIEIPEARETRKPLQIKELCLIHPDQNIQPLTEYCKAAHHSRKGLYPLQLLKEQVYWTLVGLPGDTENSLLDEYGDLESKAHGSSLMPYIVCQEKVVCALDGSPRQHMAHDHLPLPRVDWKTTPVNLQIEAFARGSNQDSSTYVLYTLTNTSKEKQTGQLLLLARPVQVNPTWQYGGISPIERIAFKDSLEGIDVFINDELQYVALTPPAMCCARTFHHGDIMEDVKNQTLTPIRELWNSGTLLSGALVYDFSLSPQESTHVVIAAPLHKTKQDIVKFTQSRQTVQTSVPTSFYCEQQKAVTFWKTLLDTVSIDLPQQEVVHTLKAQVAYILLNQDGPSIQPGSRNYKRAWIRDGSLTSAALLRMGRQDEVRAYLDWYAQQIQPDGWVPPVLQNDGQINKGFGADLEYDSQGEFIYAIMEFFRFTQDKEFVAFHFDAIVRSMKFMQRIREQTLSETYMGTEPDNTPYRGILPASFSHEGYAPPKHSYWDDFWALKGWKDGAAAAAMMNQSDIENWAREQYQKLKDALIKSICLTRQIRDIDYVPGCVELGDSDPTSTAIAFFPCNEQDVADEQTMQQTFSPIDNILQERIAGRWDGSFTPYEIRNMLALVELGHRDCAIKLLNYMLTCCRPFNWHHLAEVIHSNPRKGGYIGDMPHTWVGSGYINSVRGMLVHEKDNNLHLFAGAPLSWFKGSGIQIKELPTHFGPLNVNAKVIENQFILNMDTTIKLDHAIHVFWPFSTPPRELWVDKHKISAFDHQKAVISPSTRQITAIFG